MQQDHNSDVQAGIIDCHVHLWEARHLSQLLWIKQDMPIYREQSIQQYLNAVGIGSEATSSLPTHSVLKGFIFIEADRVNRPTSSKDRGGWESPIDEFSSVLGMIESQVHANLLMGIIAWAPLPDGYAAVKEYHERLLELTPRKSVLKGFRYLLQHIQRGVGLREPFLDGLSYMAEAGLCFELNVDVRQDGWQHLGDAVRMVRLIQDRLHGTDKKLTVILDHFGKPDLRQEATDLNKSHIGTFSQWSTSIQALASLSGTYIKLSGFLSELPPDLVQAPLTPQNLNMVAGYCNPWLKVAFEAFGSHRILWGSDWPVCTLATRSENAWEKWVIVSQLLLQSLQLSEDACHQIWFKNATEVYKIEI